MSEVRHINAETMAAFLDGRVSDNGRVSVEEHLSFCSVCCEELLSLSRLNVERKPGSAVRLVAPLAAAAILAMILVGQPWREGSDMRSIPAQRGGEATATIEVLSPREGVSVTRRKLLFAWRSADGDDTLYQLVVTTEEGDSVWSATTRDTTLMLPAGTVLELGRPYVWYVDALIEDGRPVSTGLHHFELEE